MVQRLRKKIVVLLIAAMCVLTVGGCGTKEKPQTSVSSAKETKSAAGSSETQEATKEVFAMDTYMTLTAYGADAQAAVDDAAAEITRIEEMVSTGIDTSEIAKLNQTGRATLSKDAAYLVERSLELYKSTNGAFEISIYPVMQAWGFTTQNYRVPEKKELTTLLKKVDSQKIHFSEKTGEISFEKKGMEIDLGGIAKGYTSGRIMDIFREHGIKSGVVSLGGNVQVMGTKTDGSLWRVAVENPKDEGDYLGVLETSDQAVITSGGYERYFEQDGKHYHHIINPKTGYPAQSGLSSVTIVSSDGTLADGLSTSLFIMGKEKAIAYWRQHKEEFDAILVDDDGKLFVTEGVADSFTSEADVTVVEAE